LKKQKKNISFHGNDLRIHVFFLSLKSRVKNVLAASTLYALMLVKKHALKRERERKKEEKNCTAINTLKIIHM
jgi:hypothetical protein